MRDYREDIREYLELERQVLKELDVDAINNAINLLDETRLQGGRVYICGNGGSASTASHFQNDFNKGVSEHIGIPFKFYCLSDNVSTITAIANDSSYDEIYSFQLKGNITEKDILMVISGSGNSRNVVRAAELAKENGSKVIALTGYSGGILKEMADISLHVSVDNMQISEDVHLVFDHLMMSVMCKCLS